MSDDRYAERRRRALEAAEAAGLAGLLVSPGPDLAYLTAYTPLPLERLTLLVLTPSIDPTLVVPTLERPLAERAAGAPGLRACATGATARTTRTRSSRGCSARAATR